MLLSGCGSVVELMVVHSGDPRIASHASGVGNEQYWYYISVIRQYWGYWVVLISIDTRSDAMTRL